MTSAETKTDNSYLQEKINLRAEYLPEKNPIYVLDCFAGSGLVWSGVTRKTGRTIKRLAMDQKNVSGFYLPGNNLAWLSKMDLSDFDVIDLDAYGIPFHQLEIVFNSSYSGHVFVTFIQSIYGGIPHGLLERIGFTRQMIAKCPTLFARRGWQYFLEYLASYGIKSIDCVSVGHKHYLHFIIN